MNAVNRHLYRIRLHTDGRYVTDLDQETGTAYWTEYVNEAATYLLADARQVLVLMRRAGESRWLRIVPA